jgi:hypothetical protein
MSSPPHPDDFTASSRLFWDDWDLPEEFDPDDAAQAGYDEAKAQRDGEDE